MNYEIRVWACDLRSKITYQLQWRDPVTRKIRQKTTQVPTSGLKRDLKEAQRLAAQLEVELQNKHSKEPTRISWDDFRQRYEEEHLPGLAVKTAEKTSSVLDRFEKGDEVETMIEVKRVCQNLKDDHLAQVERYALNEGCDWAVLTNGQHWKIYALELVGGRIQTQEVYTFDLLNFDCRNKTHIEMLYCLTKEGRSKGELDTHHQKKKARDQFTVAALLMHDDIVKKIRSELKKVSDGVSLSDDEIRATLQKDVIKQTILTGDEAKKAKQHVNKKLNAAAKKRQQKKKSSKAQVEKVAVDIEPNAPVAPPVQAVETVAAMETPQGTGV